MKKAIINSIPYMIIYIILFVIFPLIIKLALDSSLINNTTDIIFLLLFIVNPVSVLVIGAIFGAINGFKQYYLFIAPLLFIFSIWILYNSSALICAAAYFVLSLIGMLIGSLFYYINKNLKVGRYSK